MTISSTGSNYGSLKAMTLLLSANKDPRSRVTGNMTEPCGRVYSKGKISVPKPQSHIYQADQNRHLHQQTYDGGKDLTRVDAKHGHGRCDSEFKIVGGSSENEGSEQKIDLSPFLGPWSPFLCLFSLNVARNMH